MNKKKVKRAFLFLCKVLLSGTALFFVVRKLDFRQMEMLINRLEPAYLLPALFLYGLSKLFSIYRCNVLFRKSGIFLSNKEAIRLYWAGMYYNQFLPGGIGGDAYKVLLIKKNRQKPIQEGISAMLNDRIAGLVILCCMTSVLYYLVPFHQTVTILLAPAVILCLLIYFILLKRFFPSYEKVKVTLIAWSFGVQITQFAMVYFLMQLLEIHTHYAAYLFVFGLSSIAANIPVSLSGVGLREFVFLWGADRFQMVPEQAVFISILFYLSSFVMSLPGVIWVIRSPFESRDDLQHIPVSS